MPVTVFTGSPVLSQGAPASGHRRDDREGPDPGGVVCWRLIDLAQWIFQDFRITIRLGAALACNAIVAGYPASAVVTWAGIPSLHAPSWSVSAAARRALRPSPASRSRLPRRSLPPRVKGQGWAVRTARQSAARQFVRVDTATVSINAVLAAAGYNFSLLLRWVEELLRILSQIIWRLCGAKNFLLRRPARRINFVISEFSSGHSRIVTQL